MAPAYSRRASDPIIVGQAALQPRPRHCLHGQRRCIPPRHQPRKCDGFARINQQGGDRSSSTPSAGSKLSIPLQPKALHDEMNSSTFDEYGRMTANLGVEAVPGERGRAERRSLSVREPGDGDDRRHQPAFGGRTESHAHLHRQRRHPDLEDHAQRRGHASNPLPPLRRAGDQPRHVGQHHHSSGPDRTGLEGYGAGQPARRHARCRFGPSSQSSLRRSPTASGRSTRHADRIEGGHQQRGTRSATPTNGHHPIVNDDRQLRLGVRLALPHPQPRGDGHDAARCLFKVPGGAADADAG